MKEDSNDKRLLDILEMISNIAALDFSSELPTTGKNEMFDAIALGLNMLSEELNTQVVSKAQLNEINQKLEKFAFTTAHDLKSPLNTQSNIIFLLKNAIEENNSEDISLYIETLEKVNSEMEKLVHGILKYSIKSTNEVEEELIDFNLVIDEVIMLDNIKDKATVVLKEKLPIIKFNKSAAIQIIRNLLDNAIKYCDKPNCKVQISTIERPNHFEISFKDNGPGIAKDRHSEIFELFKTLNSELTNNSSGIGLSTVKNIIEAKGGEIWVNSTIGKGTSFIFTLAKS